MIGILANKFMLINRYTINLLINSFPGFISIFLSFFSIPIYLKFLGYEEYGNYLILHIFLSITMITNLNLGKIASIRIQKVNFFQTKKIIFTTLLVSFLSSSIITLIIFCLLTFLFSFYEFRIFENNIFIYCALFITNVYVTLENLCKGKKFFKLTSLSNFVFYSLSISLPSFVLIFDITDYKTALDLFKISFFFKVLGILILAVFLLCKKLINFGSISKIIIQDFKYFAKWQTLSAIYMQIFDFLDKYIIKIILGSGALAIYSIPQQIAGKLSLVSDALISVFLPRISSKLNKNKKYQILNSNFYSFFYLLGFPIILSVPFLNDLTIWWLGESASIQIVHLFKIFTIASFYICITHIISTFYDTNFESKKNSLIDTIVLMFFLVGLVISLSSGNIYYFAYTILGKSIFSFILKLTFINHHIIKFKILILQNAIFISAFIFQMREDYYLYTISFLIFLILLMTTAPLALIKKEFLND